VKAGGRIGFSEKTPDNEYEQMKSTVEESMKRMFNPEFINRIDDYIVFRPLTKENIYSIIDIQLSTLYKRLKLNGIDLELTQSAKDYLVDKGFDEKYGARPLRRALQRYLEDPLAEEMLRNVFKENATVRVEFDSTKNELTFDYLIIPKSLEEKPAETEDFAAELLKEVATAAESDEK